jgi:hypothetical protein
LSGAISVGHFHNAPAGTNGPVVRNHTYTANTTVGLWHPTDGQALTNTLMREMLANNIYFRRVRGEMGRDRRCERDVFLQDYRREICSDAEDGSSQMRIAFASRKF